MVRYMSITYTLYYYYYYLYINFILCRTYVFKYTTSRAVQGYKDQEEVNCVNLMFVSSRRLYFPALLNLRKNPSELILLYKACALDYYN